MKGEWEGLTKENTVVLRLFASFTKLNNKDEFLIAREYHFYQQYFSEVAMQCDCKVHS